MSEVREYHKITVSIENHDDGTRTIHTVADTREDDYTRTVTVEALLPRRQPAMSVVPLTVQHAFGKVMIPVGWDGGKVPEYPKGVEVSDNTEHTGCVFAYQRSAPPKEAK